jgi:hypothetical protein
VRGHGCLPGWAWCEQQVCRPASQTT